VTTRRTGETGTHRQAALAALALLLIVAGCAMPDPRVSWATARAALWADEPTATLTPAAGATATAMPTPEQIPAALAPTEAPTVTLEPTATPRPTATATPTISMLVGPAVPWLTVQAYTSTPWPAYVAATPPEGPAAATIPPRSFPGSPAPTWTPAPTVFPILPGQPTPGTPVGAELRLVSSTGYLTEGGGAFVVAGEVENISTQSFESVLAVVSLYDAGGVLITTDKALIEFSPLRPGVVSPFSVITIVESQWPPIAEYELAFTDFFGRPFVLE
jgi:hypothetical protein